MEEWLDIDKDNNYAKSRLGELYLKEDKKLEKALELTNEVIAFHDERMADYQKYYPNYIDFLEYSNQTLAEFYAQKGKILRKMDKYDSSTVALKLSFSLAPNNETAYLLYQSYKELDLERDQMEWGLIALVDTKKKLAQEDSSKLIKERTSLLSKQTGFSSKEIKLSNLAAKKSSLYHLGEAKKEEEQKHPLIGKNLIPLPYNTLDKKPFKWSALKGKNVLLSFWATRCVPCIQELTVLDKLKREYKGKPFEIVAICTDGISKKKDMKKILKKAKIKNLQVLQGKSDSMDIYGFNAIPTSFYIDPTGKIIDKGQGYSENLEEEIKKKLNL